MANPILDPNPERSRALAAVKLAHTAIWAFFVVCILALPVAAVFRRFDWDAALTVLVLIECGALAANHCRCPLTDMASHFTADRSENFDIYLPKWLARHNKVLFGTVFVAGELFVLWRWLA